MKSTGIVRKVDMLGRIVIPKELRNVLDVEEGTPLEIFMDEDKIVLRKYVAQNQCVITGKVSNDNTEIMLGNKAVSISKEGADQLREMLKNI